MSALPTFQSDTSAEDIDEKVFVTRPYVFACSKVGPYRV